MEIKYKVIAFVFSSVIGMNHLSAEKMCGIDGKFIHGNPAKDSVDNLKKRDRKFLAVRGIGVIIPALSSPEEEAAEVASKHYGYRIISGTSDNIINGDCFVAQQYARQYAAKYNSMLLNLLKKKK